MGSPSAPNDRQYEQLLKAGQLAELGQAETVSAKAGNATLKLNLPRQAVALLVIDWK